jgi:mersacidin/lichenicidin family type 2 lantibiotic
MKIDTVRAWKDEAYRQSLSDEQLRSLPTHPAGELELTDADLLAISGSGENDGFGCFGGGFGSSRENEFINSAAVICQNSAFSNTNTKNSVHSFINVSDICVNVG